MRMKLNKFRGHGVTIFGAIGTCLEKPLFMKCESTNMIDFRQFLTQIREAVPGTGEQRPLLNIVLDNHPAHKNWDVRNFASKLDINLRFLPPYCPQLNSIECVWSVIKRKVKQELQQSKHITLN